jgi:excisionase family DNA binding protein
MRGHRDRSAYHTAPARSSVSATRLPIIGGQPTSDAGDRMPLLFDDRALVSPEAIRHGTAGMGSGARGATARDATMTSADTHQEDPVPQWSAVRNDSAAMASSSTAPMLLTVRQVEAALQLGRTRTYELLRSGQLPMLRVGRLIRVSRVALEEWIALQVAAGHD